MQITQSSQNYASELYDNVKRAQKTRRFAQVYGETGGE